MRKNRPAEPPLTLTVLRSLVWSPEPDTVEDELISRRAHSGRIKTQHVIPVINHRVYERIILEVLYCPRRSTA